MPAVSEKQRRFFGACAHGAKYKKCPKNMSKKKMREFARKPNRR